MAKTIEERYIKETGHGHVLLRPDTYIGSVSHDTHKMWYLEDSKMVYGDVEYVPGLYKIFDELIVNMADHRVNDPTCNDIAVTIDPEAGVISCYNNGENGIPVHIHGEYKVYVPELIFGHLLTSSNYDDSEERRTGGRNGYGAKLTNIFSKRFIIEVVDMKSKKKYVQEYSDNMYTRSEPIITKMDKGTKNSYVKITYTPDFARFGIEGYSKQMIQLFEKRVYDLALCTDSQVTVSLNGSRVNIDSFESYVRMFYDEMPSAPICMKTDHWDLCFVFNPDSGYRQVSFVNSICTFKGGSHEAYIVERLISDIQDYIQTSHKVAVKPASIKGFINIFIKSSIVKPAFSSQIKEELTTKSKCFGSVCTMDKEFIKLICATKIVEEAIAITQYKDSRALTKSDGKKTSRINLHKLEDANWAGTTRSGLCTLILVEGDSAKAFAMCARTVLGCDTIGVFPLKGKPVNVRDKSAAVLAKNEELGHLKQVLGLKQDAVYEDTKQLRYGHVLILTDQDPDGSHIKGLIINMFHHLWPSLLMIEGFIQTLSTPLVKAWPASDKSRASEPLRFYNMSSYEEWTKTVDAKKWQIKYYKGLGTSTEPEAEESFRDYHDRFVDFIYEADSVSDGSIITCFSKNRSDDRKLWLEHYDRTQILDPSQRKVPISVFFNREFIHFSNYSSERAIPCICDGFKPGQRKVFYGSVLRKIFNKELKVAQLGGFISDKAAYHHGETSLEQTIIHMAQDFVGSNNINLLLPNGGFGNRAGCSPSSARYIFTQLSELVPHLFNKLDDHVYEYNFDDGTRIEPTVYAPTIPMVLVNGIDGIGTGWSTDIPSYNPKDIMSNIRRMIKGKETKPMIPWFKGFTGSVTEVRAKKGAGQVTGYVTTGKYTVIDPDTVQITELPIGVWFNDYKETLDSLIVTKPKKGEPEPKKTKKSSKFTNLLVSWDTNCTNESANFILHFAPGRLQDILMDDSVIQALKLTSSVSITNMHCYNVHDQIRHYQDVDQILKEYYEFRLGIYDKRKIYALRLYKNEINIVTWKIKFLEMVNSGEIEMSTKIKKSAVIDRLVELGFPKLSLKVKGDTAIKQEDGDGDGEEEGDGEAKEEEDTSEKSYQYITRLSLFSLTEEELEKLKKDLEKKTAEYETYNNTSIQDMWLSELASFEEAYDAWLIKPVRTVKQKKQQPKKDKKGKAPA